jgi:hypothetical protein
MAQFMLLRPLFLQSNVLDVTTRQDPGMPRAAEACDTEEYCIEAHSRPLSGASRPLLPTRPDTYKAR